MGTLKLNWITKCCKIVADILPAPSPPLTKGSKGQNSTYSEHSQVAYQIKGNNECSNMIANNFPADSPSPTTLDMGSIGQNSTFSEHGHVACEIKWNHEMQQHGKHGMKYPPPNADKSQLFQNMVMLHIKLKGIMNAATW